MTESANIARFLPAMSEAQPATAALKIPQGRRANGEIDYLTLNFLELDLEVAAWMRRLREHGVKADDRVLVMVRQGLPLIASVFALFAVGAVPIVIDPGMGLKSFLSCVARSRPRVLLGIPLARALSRLCWRAFRTVETRVPASGNALHRLTARRADGDAASGPERHDATNTSRRNEQSSHPAYASVAGPERTVPLERNATDLAAILFTSGSTGAPKGVCYEHGMFEAQVRLIRSAYTIEPGEIDLPMLPIFALFNPALGMTTIVPEIDPSRPASVDPAKIVQAIRQERVTNSFGSPTLWNKIAEHCIQSGTTLPDMKRVLCAGAPVPASLWEQSRVFLPQGLLHSPYGATEALPVASLSAEEREALRVPGLEALIEPAFGACVGHPLPELRVKIVEVSDAPLATLASVRECEVGEVGEIIVAGPVVTTAYDALPEATAAAKIREGSAVWHRMGDCGSLDAEGRLWFCGRKAERVVTAAGVLMTEPCEHVFREVPGVRRCALIGLGARPEQLPALVVEPRQSPLADEQKKQLAEALRAAGKRHAATRAITRFYFHSNFPVDVRHNAKIHRLTLAQWARQQTPIEVP